MNVIDNNTSLTRDQINGLVRDFTQTEFEKFDALRRAVALAPELCNTLGQEVIDQAITRRKLIRSITDDKYILVQGGFDEFLEARGVILDRSAATYCEVTKALAVGQLEIIDLMARGASLAPQSIETTRPALLMSVATDPVAADHPPSATKHSKTIAGLIEPYMRERDRGGISDSYARDIRTAMAWFSKWFGSSRAVSSLTPEEMRDFKDGLLLLPANWSKKFKTLSIREAAKLNEDGHLPKLEVQALNSKRWILQRFAIALGVLSKTALAGQIFKLRHDAPVRTIDVPDVGDGFTPKLRRTGDAPAHQAELALAAGIFTDNWRHAIREDRIGWRQIAGEVPVARHLETAAKPIRTGVLEYKLHMMRRS
jgi:hypothetical protein